MRTTQITAAEAELLERGGFSLKSDQIGAGDSLFQTAADYSVLLHSSLSTAETAKRLGVDECRILQRLSATPPTLYGILLETSWRIPDFQFDGEELVKGLGEVVLRLDPELHPLAVFRWFTTPNADLTVEALAGRSLSPRDWLRVGLPLEPVLEMASNL